MTDRASPAMPDQADYVAVHTDIVALLESTRRAAACSVNALMTASYWQIGRRIVEFDQGGQERAARGLSDVNLLEVKLDKTGGVPEARQIAHGGAAEVCA